MKVLITGFDPFGGETINPAWEAVKLLPDRIAGAEIIKLQIPTVVGKSIHKIHEAMKQENPDLIISIGQAGGRFGVTPERVAINVTDARIMKETSPLTNRFLQTGLPHTSAACR